MAQVLIAGKDWTSRALLRAQLLEEGFDVEAFESINEAVKRLWSNRAMTALLIADLFDSENPVEDVSKLSPWIKLVPVWVLAGHSAGGLEELEGYGFERLLFRPLDMRRLVQEIKERLAGPGHD